MQHPTFGFLLVNPLVEYQLGEAQGGNAVIIWTMRGEDGDRVTLTFSDETYLGAVHKMFAHASKVLEVAKREGNERAMEVGGMKPFDAGPVTDNGDPVPDDISSLYGDGEGGPQ